MSNSCTFVNVRLVADPETKEFGDRKLTELRIADNPIKKMTKAGLEIPARFITCKIWGPRAEAAAKLRKGDMIAPSGMLTYEVYTSNKTGQVVTRDVLEVDRFEVSKSETFFEMDGGPKSAAKTAKIPF